MHCLFCNVMYIPTVYATFCNMGVTVCLITVKPFQYSKYKGWGITDMVWLKLKIACMQCEKCKKKKSIFLQYTHNNNMWTINYFFYFDPSNKSTLQNEYLTVIFHIFLYQFINLTYVLQQKIYINCTNNSNTLDPCT